MVGKYKKRVEEFISDVRFIYFQLDAQPMKVSDEYIDRLPE